MPDVAAEIGALRASSNLAIAARDLEGVIACMHEDVSVSVAGGPTLVGREASRRAFAEQFAERGFGGYVRTPREIFALDSPALAMERGVWEGRWLDGSRERIMRGSYLARWRMGQLGWQLISEVFVQD